MQPAWSLLAISASTGWPSGPSTGWRVAGSILGVQISTMHIRHMPTGFIFGW